MDIGNNNNKNHINKKFDWVCSYLQRVATTKWFLCSAMYDIDKTTHKTFMICIYA